MSVESTPNRRCFQPWEDKAAVPYVEFRNVTKRYGTVTAVSDLTLNIFEREFFALLGPSGCGKSTLMRMLAGLETVTEGSICLAGENLSEIPPHRRPVNMMFQSYALFPHMNVEKNVAFGLKQEGMAKAEIADRVAEMLSLVKMQDFAKRKPDQLSGGQKQRVALARSLAKQPKLLLLDEPLGALDRKLREETQFELIDLQERLGITFMIVTHDQEEAMTVADRIAVMEQGKIVQVSPPVELYEQPENRYVAGFLGDINVFPATVRGSTKGTIKLQGTDQSPMEVESNISLTAGDSVFFAVRPEKMEIGREQPSGDVNAFSGEVWDIAYLGGVTSFKVKLDNGAFAKATVLNHTIDTDIPLTWEDRVWLHCSPGSALVLTS